jgi:hypothetical protein
MNSPQNMMNSPQQSINQNMQLLNSIPNLTDVCAELTTSADLNFDPAAIIDGEGGNDLNVREKNLPHIVNPMILIFVFSGSFSYFQTM